MKRLVLLTEENRHNLRVGDTIEVHFHDEREYFGKVVSLADCSSTFGFWEHMKIRYENPLYVHAKEPCTAYLKSNKLMARTKVWHNYQIYVQATTTLRWALSDVRVFQLAASSSIREMQRNPYRVFASPFFQVCRVS